LIWKCSIFYSWFCKPQTLWLISNIHDIIPSFAYHLTDPQNTVKVLSHFDVSSNACRAWRCHALNTWVDRIFKVGHRHRYHVAKRPEWLTCVPRVRKVESSFPKDRPNLTQHCKRFAIASTSTQVAVLPWRYDAEMGISTCYTLRRNTASIMKGLFWFGQWHNAIKLFLKELVNFELNLTVHNFLRIFSLNCS